MKKEFTTHSAKETAMLGKRLGSLINEKCTIAFRGGLGSGKTCFSVGVAQGLDYFGEANSPTFAIVNEYLGGRMPIYHFDMYRIADEDELYGIGYYDYLDEDHLTRFAEIVNKDKKVLLKIGKMEYKVVVLSDNLIIRGKSFEILKQRYDNGLISIEEFSKKCEQLRKRG